MAANERFETTVPRMADRAEPSLGELFRQLSADTTTLVRNEVALAKTEVREVGSRLASDAGKVGIGASLALVGLFALTAFLILALGALIGIYWLSALIVGALMVGIGGFMAKNAIDDIKRRGIKPQQTVQTLREDAEWAKQESREFKRELTK